jgi:hypothetical protein
MKTMSVFEETSYIELPRRSKGPVKIDAILEARMRAFLRARRVRRFTFMK